MSQRCTLQRAKLFSKGKAEECTPCNAHDLMQVGGIPAGESPLTRRQAYIVGAAEADGMWLGCLCPSKALWDFNQGARCVVVRARFQNPGAAVKSASGRASDMASSPYVLARAGLAGVGAATYHQRT